MNSVRRDAKIFFMCVGIFIHTNLLSTSPPKQIPWPPMPQLPHKVPSRLIIYAKDIQNITGRRPRTARRLLAQIRHRYKKTAGSFVTIKEFSEFTGIPEEEIQPYLFG